ncbi:MAG: transposase [Halofilum sp. (in: g-proteobacteria)]|nr:transposase [Halofilum sp. (in: g-proteobacteria)]
MSGRVWQLAFGVCALFTLATEGHIGSPAGSRAQRELEEVFIDSTAVRPPGAGGRGEEKRRASVGDLVAAGTNQHDHRCAGQSAGLSASLAPGNNAIGQASALLQAVATPAAVIGDKGYDADALADQIEQRGAEAVIPPRSNRRSPRSWDTHRYRARHLIENLFARLSDFAAWRPAMEPNSLLISPPLSPSPVYTSGFFNLNTLEI